MTKKQYLPYFVISILIFAVFFTSLLVFLISKDTHRRTFVFPSAEDGKYIVEYRNLSKNTYQGDIQYFVEEILLGSTVERTKKLFTPGTKLLSCFKREGTLYINLSQDLLQMGEGVVDIREGTDLLIMNIKQNFSGINNVEIFIEGKSAFEK